MTVGQEEVSLQCWDTAGQEKYHSVGATFYKGADCCALVYDITDEKSFRDLDEWKKRFLTNCGMKNPDAFPFVVIGNKLDLEQNRQVNIFYGINSR